MKSNEIDKARLCFDGRFQTHGLDFDETFSPVAKYASIHMAMFFIVQNRGEIYTADVPSTFLNSPVDVDVYMKHPDGFESHDGTVLKLNCALYGMKQAPKLWNSVIDDFVIKNLEMTRFEDDSCIYYRKEGELFTIIILYIDGSNNRSSIDGIMDALENHFNVKKLGPINNSYYLRMYMNVSEDRSAISKS